MLQTRSLRKLLATQVKLYLREPIAVFFTLFMPVALLVMLGFIIGNEPVPELGGRGHLDANLPGYAALVIGIVGIAGVPIETATRREAGILRRFRATPLRPLTYIAGDVLANFLMMVLGVVAVFLLGRFGFGVPFHGSLPSLALGVFLSAAAFLSVAYVLGSVLPTARVATVVGNFLLFPMVVLSGAVVPQQIMPETVQNVAKLVPLTHVVRLFGGLWSGHRLSEHLLEIFVLGGFLVVGVALAARFFRWE
ncbi:MAG: ABC transporter permease [bacterium]|nr:ABC transporter permease [bacterium]